MGAVGGGKRKKLKKKEERERISRRGPENWDVMTEQSCQRVSVKL